MTNEARWLKKTIVDNDIDMYNLTTGAYVFHYNNEEAIAVYYMDVKDAGRLAAKASESGEYWGGLLGVGGDIYDDPWEYLGWHWEGVWVNANHYFRMFTKGDERRINHEDGYCEI